MSKKIDWVISHPSLVIRSLLVQLGYSVRKALWSDSRLCSLSSPSVELAHLYVCADSLRLILIQVLQQSRLTTWQSQIKQLEELRIAGTASLNAMLVIVNGILPELESGSSLSGGHARMRSFEEARKVLLKVERGQSDVGSALALAIYWQQIHEVRSVVGSAAVNIAYDVIQKRKSEALLNVIYECCTIRAWS